MIAIIFGILCILFFIYAVVPFSWGLCWTEEFLYVLKGGLPIFALIIGVLCGMIGIADTIDKRNAKKETQLQKEFEEQDTKQGK